MTPSLPPPMTTPSMSNPLCPPKIGPKWRFEQQHQLPERRNEEVEARKPKAEKDKRARRDHLTTSITPTPMSLAAKLQSSNPPSTSNSSGTCSTRSLSLPSPISPSLSPNPKTLSFTANKWGIVKSIVDLCMKPEEGKYVLVKDRSKHQVGIYQVPPDAFENDYVAEPIPEEEQVQPPAEGADDGEATASTNDVDDNQIDDQA